MEMLHVYCDTTPAICSQGLLLGLSLIIAFTLTVGGLVLASFSHCLGRRIRQQRGLPRTARLLPRVHPA